MSEFTIGMKVVYSDPHGRQYLDTVEKVTPKGGVRIKHHLSLLFWNGSCKSGEYHFHNIWPATEDDLKSFRRSQLIQRIKKFDWGFASTSFLEELDANLTSISAATVIKEDGK